MDLIVMDGSIKRMGYSFLEDGSMFKVEETVKSFELEEEEEKEEATTEGLTAEMEEEEEEEEELVFDVSEVIKEEPEEEKKEEEKINFGEFLDLMEVF